MGRGNGRTPPQKCSHLYMLEKPNEGRGAVGGLGEVGVDIIALQKNTATVVALKLNMRFSFKYKDAVQRHMRFI